MQYSFSQTVTFYLGYVNITLCRLLQKNSIVQCKLTTVTDMPQSKNNTFRNLSAADIDYEKTEDTIFRLASHILAIKNLQKPNSYAKLFWIQFFCYYYFIHCCWFVNCIRTKGKFSPNGFVCKVWLFRVLIRLFISLLAASIKCFNGNAYSVSYGY